MFLIDSHCHIDRLNYNLLHKNIEDVLKKSFDNHVKKILTVSTSIKNFYKIQKFCKKNISILYTCGIHPLNCEQELSEFNSIKNITQKLEKLSSLNHVIAIGETGLDYYYSSKNKNLQQEFFREHIRIAIKLKKPIIIHSRNAINDTIKILKEEHAEKCKGILHSFSENCNSAYELLDMGFYISFSGMITFKNSLALHSIIKKIPLEHLLIETDSPYLSPVPYRGKENQPAYLLEIAKKISILKNMNIEKISKITTNNFNKLFNLEKIES